MTTIRRGILMAATWLAAAGAVPAEWADTRVIRPLIVRADFPLERLGLLGDELARLQDDLAAHLAVPKAGEWIELYLFADRRSYVRYMRRHMPELPLRRALYVKRDGPGMVFAYRSEQFATDLRHETTHALLHAVLPRIPLWLDEGLAEYFETPRARRLEGGEHWAAARRSASLGRLAQLRELEEMDDASRMGREDYQAAWAWTHFLLHGPVAAREELLGYLADLRGLSPRPGPEPLSERLGRRLGDAAAALRRHLRRAGRRGAEPMVMDPPRVTR